MELIIQEFQAQFIDQLHSISETASLDVQVLLAHFLEKPRSWILAHPEAILTQTQSDNLLRAVNRLLSGEPLPYVIGHWEFYGLEFQLTPDVLIPRPETEILVERAINWLRLHPHKRNALDVGTGSGCIGISLAKIIPDLRLTLTDISSQALDVAQGNARKHGVSERIKFIQADLMSGIIGPFDLICANLPYIPTQLLKTLPVAEKEPHLALNGGLSGTELISELLKQSRSQLVSGGAILLEIEASQGDEVKALGQSLYSLSKVEVMKDLSGRDRCLEIERPDMLVHICSRSEWMQAHQIGEYRDVSLEQAGFIHCSQPEQVLEVANRFYLGVTDLVALWLEPGSLAANIRWEYVDGVFFPHLYGPINLEAVTAISQMPPDHDGIFRLIQLPG